MKIGVAHSMLMAGVYYENTDEKLAEHVTINVRDGRHHGVL